MNRKDYRNGPHPGLVHHPFRPRKRSALTYSDWDPSKWFIHILHHYTSLVPTIAQTPESAVLKARARVHMAEADRLVGHVTADQMVKNVEDLPVWSRRDILRRNGEITVVRESINGEGEKRKRVLLLLEGCVIDVGGYLEDHVSLFCFTHTSLVDSHVDIDSSLGENTYFLITRSVQSQRDHRHPPILDTRLLLRKRATRTRRYLTKISSLKMRRELSLEG